MYPQAFGPPSAGAYGYAPLPPQQPAKRGKAWIWITAVVVVLILGLISACALPFVFLASDDGLDAGMGDDAVGVIHIDGAIVGTGDYYSGYITPDYVYEQLEQAEEDDRVKALVLKVDSPGGTVAASEEIATYIKEFDKPVIVSSGDVNASGAYMVSSQADQIWALPGTAVGSIGVITEIPNVSGLLDKMGVEFTVITSGKYKDAGSPFRALTEEEKAMIQGQVDEAYSQFIGIVAEGRDMPRSKVESLATGWAWSGSEAKKLGLVDKVGTHQDALDAAAKAGKIDGDYDVVDYGDEYNDFFGSFLGVTESLKKLSTLADEVPASAKHSVPK